MATVLSTWHALVPFPAGTPTSCGCHGEHGQEPPGREQPTASSPRSTSGANVAPAGGRTLPRAFYGQPGTTAWRSQAETVEDSSMATPAELASSKSEPSKAHPLFSAVRFSLPDRTPRRAKNGGIPIIRVEYILAGMLQGETAVWENEEWDAREGCFVTTYSVSLPRGLRAIANDPISQAIVLEWREQTVTAGMAFYDAATGTATDGKGKLPTPIGRLVRKRQPTASELAAMQAKPVS